MRNIWQVICVWFLSAASAFAADPFTVVGVRVDASASTVTQAQTNALSQGQIRAAEMLIDRLTDPSARQASGYAGLDAESAGKMIRALEVNNERRSATRYVGDISVAFNPSAVKSYLDGLNIPMMASQARERVVVPMLGNEAVFTDNAWQKTWQTNKFMHSLAPVRGIYPGQTGGALIDNTAVRAATVEGLADFGRRIRADHILVALAEPGSSGLTVRLIDVQLDTKQRTELGSVSGTSYSDTAQKVVALLETNWKQASMVSNTELVQIPVSVLYRSHADWQNLQTVINTSGQIRDARLDAVSKDGALMTLTYGGDLALLQNELSFKGVTLTQDPELGTTLTRSGRY